MQLGSILSEQIGEPCVSHPVEFHLFKQTREGKKRFRVRALMFPVGEAERLQSERAAESWLRQQSDYQRTDKGELPPIPGVLLAQERVYRFLVAALHCEDDPVCKLVGADDYATFRAGLVNEQIDWLWEQYKAFIQREYSELAPIDKLKEEALKNSGAAQSAQDSY